MTKPIVVFRNFAAAFKFLYTCSDDHLHGQKRERERDSVMFPMPRRQATV